MIAVVVTVMVFRSAKLMLFLTGAVVTGCSTSDPRSDNYDPTLAAVSQTLSRPDPLPPESFVETGARRGGAFPTFGRMPESATEQMTDVEREMMEAEMAALLAEQRNDRVAATRYRETLIELRKIARNHGRETTSQIEN